MSYVYLNIMWLHQAHIVILQHILLLLLIIQCHIKTYKFVSTIHNKFCAPTYTIRNVFEQPSHKLCKALRLRSLLVFHVGNNATTMTNSGAEPTRRPTEPTTRRSRAEQAANLVNQTSSSLTNQPGDDGDAGSSVVSVVGCWLSVGNRPSAVAVVVAADAAAHAQWLRTSVSKARKENQL